MLYMQPAGSCLLLRCRTQLLSRDLELIDTRCDLDSEEIEASVEKLSGSSRGCCWLSDSAERPETRGPCGAGSLED